MNRRFAGMILTSATAWRRSVVGSLLLVSACGGPLTPNEETNRQVAQARAAVEHSYPENEGAPIDLTPPAGTTRSRVTAFRERGTGAYAAGTRPATPPHFGSVGETANISFNYFNADVKEVVRSVLGETLHLPYAIDSTVQGTITLQTPGPVREDEALVALSNALRSSNFAMVESGGLYRVVPVSAAAQEAQLARPGPGTYGTRIINLQYVSAAEVVKVLQPLLPTAVSVHADPDRNVVIVSGSEEGVQDVINKIAVFDVDYLKGLSFELLPLQNAQAAAVGTEVTTLLGGSGGVTEGLIHIVPIERLNALLVTAVRPAYLSRVEQWVKRLDQPATGDTLERKLFVYRVQNGRATDLSATLHKVLIGGSGDEDHSSSRGAAGLAQASPSTGGLTDASNVPEVLQGGLPGGGSRTVADVAHPSPLPQGAEQDNEGGADSAMRGVRITADDENNAILVMGTAAQFGTIEAALRQLDRQPLQVLIEATVAEVSLTNQLAYGLQYAVKSGSFQAAFAPSAVGASTTTSTSGTAGVAAGLASLLTSSSAFNLSYVSGASTSVLLQLLQGLTEVKVLSSPNLLVLNDQSAQLQVGDQVPIATQSSQSTLVAGSPIVNSIEYRDTGVILKITPRVNSSGLVLLDVDQEVSNVSTTTSSNLDTPTISQRRVNSSIAVADGQTVALAGLISDTRSKTKNGIPILQNIPVVGFLFGTTNKSLARDELIVLITPHIVRNQLAEDAVTEELRQKVPLAASVPYQQ